MAGDLRSLLDTLDDAIQAYKARIAELEAIVQTQQRMIQETSGKSEVEGNDAN